MNVKQSLINQRADRHDWTERCTVFPLWEIGQCSGLHTDYNSKKPQQPAANHVSDNSNWAHALFCICPRLVQKKKETSGIATTIYYPSDFFFFLRCVHNKCHITPGCMLFFSVVAREACVYQYLFLPPLSPPTLRRRMHHDSASKWNH